MHLARRIAALSAEQREILEEKLKQRQVDILQFPILPVPRDDEHPLSFGQERLWFIDQLEPGNPAYNMVRVTRLEGGLDTGALGKSIDRIVQRHEILRASFIVHEEKPVQVIDKGLSIPLDIIDLENLTPEVRREKIETVIRRESLYAFELSKGPKLRTHLLRLNPREHLFILVIHHIITDGTAVQFFIRELVQWYRAFIEGKDVPGNLPDVSVQYIDFIHWQRKWMQVDDKDANGNGSMKKQEAYWMEQFSGEIPVLNLPADFSRPAIQGSEGNSMDFRVDSTQVKVLREIISGEGLTMYILLLSLLDILLYKLSGMQDIIVGTPVACRRHPATVNMFGMFVNTLALRNYPSGDKTLRDFLAEVKTRTLQAFENQEYRYEDIIARAAVTRDTSRNPLFDVMFLLKNLEYAQVRLPGLTMTPLEYKKKTSMFDLTLSAFEDGDSLLCNFEYSTRLFKKSTVERFAAYFQQIIRSVVELHSLDTPLAEIGYLPEEEKRKILLDFNDTHRPYSSEKTIHQLFKEQAVRTPEKTAVVFGSRSLSYRRLDRQSDGLARYLREKGVNRGDIVGVMLNRSAEMLVALLGVLKAGGAYLPIDPGFPRERIDYMMTDSRASLLLTTGNMPSLDTLPGFDAASHGGLAYVIYTSGSTGKPKGVTIRHGNVVNFIHGMTGIIDFSPGDTMLSLTTISFDIFVLETFVPLTCGTAVIIGSEEEQSDASAAFRAMREKKVTHLQVTPSRLQLLLHHRDAETHLNRLRYLLIGGEALPQLLRDRAAAFVTGKFINLYGPTETTVWSTYKDVSGDTAVNIGRPIFNTQIYILDKYNHVQGIGVPGELCIAGDGLSVGYLNNPELTAQKFIPPNSKFIIQNSKLYKTGDLARWLDNGDIEFLGRTDLQVKIRGFRIELGEIESRLLQHPEIKEAVVLAPEDENGENNLCAYIVVRTGLQHAPTAHASQIREFLAQSLPGYMIPAQFIPLEEIPLTPNGKLNYRALPQPRIEIAGDLIAPVDDTEIRLAVIWSDVLRIPVDKIGVDSDFFQLGGHSLKATFVTANIHKELGVKITLLEFFQYTRLQSLARFIETRKSGASIDHYRLSTHDQTVELTESRSSVSDELDADIEF